MRRKFFQNFQRFLFYFSGPSGYNLRNRKRASLDNAEENDKRQRVDDEKQTAENKIDNKSNANQEKNVESEPKKTNTNDVQNPKSEPNAKQKMQNTAPNPANGKGNHSAPSYANVAAGSASQHNTEKSDKNTDNKRMKMVEPLKQDFQESALGDEIEVNFEVLLSKEMNIPKSKVRIVFGPPLSDWNTQLVEMKAKTEKPVIPENHVFYKNDRIQLGNCRFLTGVLFLPKEFQNRNIPYKYIVVTESNAVIWEHIALANNEGKEVNRCLLVHNQITKNYFVKFDDIILGSTLSDFPLGFIFQRLGRETASLWMMPRPSELDNPNFDFESALERFEQVIKSHGSNGTCLCLGDVPCRKLNPVGYSVSEQLNKYRDNFLKRFSAYLQSDDVRKLLRTTLWLLLLVHQRNIHLNPDNSLKLLHSFELCQNALFDPDDQVGKFSF